MTVQSSIAIPAVASTTTTTATTTTTTATAATAAYFVKPRQNIGPSHYSTILGYNRYKTSELLKEEIEKGYWIKEHNPALEFGLQNEILARQFYEELTSKKVKPAGWIRLGRILGKADGLIDNDGGLEIKCHYGRTAPLHRVPIYYLVQLLGYMHLYRRTWWDLLSCVFDDNGKVIAHRIHRVEWKDWMNSWNEFWFPQINDYVTNIKWSVGP
jgi:hypothetical protein